MRGGAATVLFYHISFWNSRTTASRLHAAQYYHAFFQSRFFFGSWFSSHRRLNPGKEAIYQDKMRSKRDPSDICSLSWQKVSYIYNLHPTSIILVSIHDIYSNNIKEHSLNGQLSQFADFDKILSAVRPHRPGTGQKLNWRIYWRWKIQASNHLQDVREESKRDDETMLHWKNWKEMVDSYRSFRSSYRLTTRFPVQARNWRRQPSSSLIVSSLPLMRFGKEHITPTRCSSIRQRSIPIISSRARST